ncbi:hypothetical protein PINS_up023049 [Pythium insidiosum]|nr:hypothetical protein PINS_up023049 [Pythium insidiosum]
MSIVTGADAAAAAPHRPSPPSATAATARHPPEYINSPIPGNNWRKKRHSMTAMTMRTQLPITLAPSTSTSQSFARSTNKSLVPSAPSTPPPARGADAPRPASHIVPSTSQPTTVRPSSPYFHVKWKEEVEEIPSKPPVPPAAALSRHHSASSVSSATTASPSSTSSARSTPVLAPRDSGGAGSSRSPPPLEYSSSPVTTSSLMERFQRQQRPSTSPSTLASTMHPSSTNRQRDRDSSAPQSARPQLESVPTPIKSRRDDLRIQVSKRMATKASNMVVPGPGHDAPSLAPASTAARTKSIPIPATAAIPTNAPKSATTTTTPASAGTTRRALDFTPPTSPVAHQDILRQKQSLLNILKDKYKQEQLLKQQQEEWMRSQLSALPASANTNSSAPSMSPIHLKSGSGKKAIRTAAHDGMGDGHVASGDADGEEEEDDDGMRMPERAPALLRTVSLGHPNLRQHQPSPRLTAALMASRARKGSGDGRARTFSTDSNLSADAGRTPTKRSSGRRPQRSSGSPSPSLSQSPSRIDGRPRSYRASHDSSVSSSVSTEPTNYRRITRSLSVRVVFSSHPSRDGRTD